MKTGSEKLAFVLSGGGSLGSVQVGCLEALLEEGITPDFIVGTSVGSINGAWLAKYPSLQGILELKNMWLSKGQNSVFFENRIMQLMRIFMGRNFIHTSKNLRKLLCQYLHCSTTFEELVIPLYVTAANLQTGEKKVFSQGPLMPAILASTAIPGALKPVTIDGITYVDGGILGNCSIETALSYGATTIVAIECPHPRPRNGNGILDILKRAVWVSLDQLCHLERQRFQERCSLVILEPDIGILEHDERNDFLNAKSFIEKSKQWSKQFISSEDSAELRSFIQRRQPSHEIIQPRLSTLVGEGNTANGCCSNCEWKQWCGECG